MNRRLWRELDSPQVTMLVVLALYLAFFWVRLASYAGDISRFVVAGDRFATAGQVPENLFILPDSDGYDGQFYYLLAIEPFTREWEGYGVRMDGNPAYRQQRILYPLLVHVAALGKPLLVPLAMVSVNLLALALIGWQSGRLAQVCGHHALAGLGLALFPGLLLSFDRDLTEITEILFFLATLLELVQARPRYGLAAVCLCLALLAKETSLGLAIAALPAAGWGLYRRQRERHSWVLFVAPMLLYVAWQAWLRANWGMASLSGNVVRSNVNVPGASSSRLPPFIQALVRYVPQGGLTAWELLLLALFGLVVLGALWRSRASLHIKLAFVAYLGLMMIIRHYGGGDWAFLRALAEYWMLGGIILLTSWRWSAWPWALITSWFWVLLALQLVLYR
ncbi:MAG: hypothetical protein ABFD20_04000 [Anaerolineales bacterium]